MKSFVPPDPEGMRDYYAVFQKHQAELDAHVLKVCDGIPALATLIRQLGPKEVEARTRESREQLRKAVFEREWKPLLEAQREQGALYARMNVPLSDWFDLVGAYQRVFYPHLVKAYASEPARLSRVLFSLSDWVDQSLSIIGNEYLAQKEKIIIQQAESIQELSTPVLQVRDRLLLIPLVGVLDTHRARAVTESLLLAVREHRAKVVVIDITGVAAVDSKVANHLFQTVAAAGLMGAKSIVTGISAEVAQALVVLGVDIGRFTTAGDLQGGLEQANQMLETNAGGNHAGTDPQAP